MAVMGGGVLINLITFNYLRKCSKKMKYGTVAENLKIDTPLLVGAGIFGLGWGFAGMCPGPAIVSFGGLTSTAKYFIPSMILGMKINDLFKKKVASNKLESVKSY
jgi:uncharacterized membrane protein YedE/YeeE